MGLVSLLLLGTCALGVMAYLPMGKEHLVSESLLREVVERMGRDLDRYLEGVGVGVGMGTAGRPSQDKDAPEDSLFYQDSPPAIRDQEYLQHSTLWANRFMQGQDDENGQRVKPGAAAAQLNNKMKQDNSLPAYCNPPNPCPVGYSGNQGCLEDFENSAAFSREYQAQQECMCDSEHMFDCNNPANGNEISELDRIVQHFQVEDEHKSLVAKKFHVKKSWNPYLLGEKLPVAAKKGQNVFY